MTLREKQSKFVLMIAQLINKANELGYELTFGDAYRDIRLHGKLGEKLGYGAANSLHKLRLAVDFNLFKDGEFLQDIEGHKPLGEYWESIGGTWGGRFNDANHYSLEHEGKK
jgi:hypothetical protein